MRDFGKTYNLQVHSLNVDGLNMESMVMLQNYMETYTPDVLVVQETHMRSDELSMDTSVAGYYHAVAERGGAEKKGGGLAIYWKSFLKARVWTSQGGHTTERVINERMWLLVEAYGNKRIAIANVYMAAQTWKNDTYLDWNTEMYNMLKHEVQEIRELGFTTLLLGDYNGHIGTLDGALSGNDPNVNTNGQKVLEFVADSNLVILNVLNNSEQVFTRQEYYRNGELRSQSCLDRALLSADESLDGWKFDIWDIRANDGLKTDHCVIKITCALRVLPHKQEKQGKQYDFDDAAKLTQYKQDIRMKIGRRSTTSFKSKSVEDQSEILHEIMIEAADSNLLIVKKQGKVSRRINAESRALLEARRRKRVEINREGATNQNMAELNNISTALSESIINGILQYKSKMRLQLALKVKLIY